MEDVEEEEEEVNNNNKHNSSNNNNLGEKNHNTIFDKFTDRSLNIEVTAKVLFGSVTAISALNAERKKKPGSPASQ